MKPKILAFVPVLFLFMSCVSVPVPSSEKNALLAGKFLVDWGTIGKIKSGISVYLQNNKTGKTTSVSTQMDGWLLTNKFPAGDYTISKLVIEQEQGNVRHRLTSNTHFYISIKDGKVTNLGTIQINIVDDRTHYRFTDYDVVKLDFQDEFPDSKWNSYEWIDTPPQVNR